MSNIEKLSKTLNSLNPKILYVSSCNPLSSRGGLEVYVHDVTKRLSELLPDGKIMCLYSAYDFDEPRKHNPKISMHPVYMGYSPKSSLYEELDLFKNLRFLAEASKLIQKTDLVHIQSPFYIPSFLTAAMYYSCRKPVIVTPHQGGSSFDTMSWKGIIRYRTLRKVYRTIIKPMFTVLSKDSTKLTKSPSICISSYLPEEFDKQRMQEYDFDLMQYLNSFIGDKKPILQVASINKRKNQLTTLNALNDIFSGNDNFVGIFVSGNDCPEYRKEIDSFIREKNISDKIIFTKKIPHDKMPSVYKAVSEKKGVMVLPSTLEGLPLAMLEAMGFGIPVISTKRDGMQDIITNDFNGYVIEDPSDFMSISKFTKNITNKKRYSEFSDNAYHTSRRFSIDNHVEKLLVLYSSMMGLSIPKTEFGLPHYSGVIELSDILLPSYH